MLKRNYYYNNLLKTEYKILKYVGLWTEDEEQKNTKLYYVYILFINTFYSLFDLSHLIQAYLVINDIPKFAYTCYLLLVISLIQINSFCLFVYRKEVAELNTLMEAEEFQMFTENHKIIVDQNINIFKTIRKIQYFGVMIEALFLAVTAIAPIIIQQDRSLQLTDYWFPFDYKISPNYECVVAFQLVTSFTSALAYVSFQFTVAAYFTFISIQCDLLCYNLRHVKEKPKENDASQFECHFSTCVNQYIKIKRFKQLVIIILEKVFLAELVAVTLDLCLSVIVVTSVNYNGGELLFQIIFTFELSLVLFVPCWFASRVTTKSEPISYSIFESDWFDASNSFKKNIISFCQQSEKPIEIEFMSIFIFNIPAFVLVVRRSFSFYTMLTTINEK